MFTHLNLHSYYSLLRGTASPEELCQAVKNLGMDTIALTDTNGLYGLVLFLEAAKDHNLRPIVGAEIRGTRRTEMSALPPKIDGEVGHSCLTAPSGNAPDVRLWRKFPDYFASVPAEAEPRASASADSLRVAQDFPEGTASWRSWASGYTAANPATERPEASPLQPDCRAIALVKNQTGYANLCRILSDRHLNDNFDLAEDLSRYGEGLVIITESPILLEKLAWKHPDLFAELTAGPGFRERLQFFRSLDVPLVASNRVHFLRPEDYQLHRLLRAIDLNTTQSRLPEDELESPQSYLKTPQEMEDNFFFCPEAIANTQRIADMCRFQPDFGLVFPQFENLGSEETFERLRQEAYRGAKKRYGEITDQVRSRLEHELALIKEKNFASIFLVVQDIVKRSPRTCGRGSAAASIVSYCLEITHVDPIRHNLYFERFLNPGRVDPPDIDVDFAWDERDDVLDYVFRTYGQDRVAMISNHVTFQTRAAIHEVAKVYGLPEAEITAVTKKLSGYWDDFEDDPKNNPALRYHDFSPPWPDILELAKQLDGIPRHLSVHCGGVVITPDAISNHVPVQRAVKEVNIIHWEKDQAEDAGLVKIDLLGNRSLAVIRDALAMIEENYGTHIDYASWNSIDDPETQKMIARGDTMGVFYVESPATRLLQKKAQVGDFDHLVIHSSIIRPAANPYIHDYLERLKGKLYQPLHPLIGDLLAETFGIMVYQEDVSRVAEKLAGFDSSEADELRKILSKKHKLKRLQDLQKKFVRGALQRGVDRESIRAIWEMILSFSGYSFCKPHSASFALVSFQSAWLRVHYPAEFMAAVISNQGGYYSTFAYISEARRLGLEILMPDVNESRVRYWGKNRQIRVGFMQIKGLTQKGMERIVACRGVTGEDRHSCLSSSRQTGMSDLLVAGPYRSFDDFLRRTDLDPADVRLLIKAGAFDSLEGRDRRAELMWRLTLSDNGRMEDTEGWKNGNEKKGGTGYYRKLTPVLVCQERRDGYPVSAASTLVDPPLFPLAKGGDRRSGGSYRQTGSLFAEEITDLPNVPPYDPKTLLKQELETFGFLISRHPLELYQERLARVNLVSTNEMHRHVGQQVQMAGWLITGKVVSTKKKELMEFLTFEDLTGLIETVFFPRVYDRYVHMLNKSRPYLLKGKVEEDFGAVTLTVSGVNYL